LTNALNDLKTLSLFKMESFTSFLRKMFGLLTNKDISDDESPKEPKGIKEEPKEVSVKEETKDANDEECPICYLPYGIEIMTLKCKHKFHTTCGIQWLTQHNSCPMCRAKSLDIDVKDVVKNRLDTEEKRELERVRLQNARDKESIARDKKSIARDREKMINEYKKLKYSIGLRSDPKPYVESGDYVTVNQAYKDA
jgi:hypothetical protein